MNINWKTGFQKIALFPYALLFVAFFTTLLELFLYRGALVNNIGVSLQMVLWAVFASLVVGRLFLKISVSERFFIWYAFLFTPLVAILAVGANLANAFFYPNFIYSTFHIDTSVLIDSAFFMALFTVPLLQLRVVGAYWRQAIFVSGVVVFFLYVLMKWRFPDVFYALDQEDGFLEYAQSIFFLSAAVFSALSFYHVMRLRIKKHLQVVWLVLFGLSAVMLFIIAGEEVSWGQRIFNIETPERLSEINQQNETTLHNVSFVFRYVYDAYLLMGVWGLVSWIAFYIRGKVFNVPIYDYVRPVLSRWYLAPFFLVIIGYVVWRYALTSFYEITAGYFGQGLVDNSFDVWEEAAETFPAIAICIIFLRGFLFVKSYAAKKH